MYVCVQVCEHGAGPIDARGSAAPGAEVMGPGCELPGLMLGIELQSSTRTGSALNYQVVSLALKLTFLLMNPRHLPLA